MNIVLVVGERPEQASSLSERLGISGVEAIPCARDWKLVVRSLTSHPVSLILLDVDSTPGSIAFFELVRELTDVPVVARGSLAVPESAIWYLDNGAVDYVARTMAPSVLAAKLSTVLRSAPRATPSGFIELGDLLVDLDRYSVTRSGRAVALTPIEFRLLKVMAENAGKACSHDMLLEKVWGDDFRDCSNYLRLYIGYLRQKLEDNPKRPKLLLTEWGYGYRLAETQPQTATSRRRAFRMAASG